MITDFFRYSQIACFGSERIFFGWAMGLLICPECAYTTSDLSRRFCEYCKAELIHKCPFCGATITEKPAIYCGQCGEKLRISYVPIQ